jgi:hypothetical protein
MDREQINVYRDKLHREIVRHVTRLSMSHGDFDVILSNPVCTTLPSGFIVTILGIDGETCRLITGKSDGVRVDYPRLKTNELESLHKMITQMEYQTICIA